MMELVSSFSLNPAKFWDRGETPS